MTLGVLGLATVLVYGCLGAYALIHLTQVVPTNATGSEQAAGITLSEPSLAAGTATTDTVTLSPQAAGAPLPINTKVIPLDGGASLPPTPDATSASSDAPHAGDTAQPTFTAAPVATPSTLPASPTPDRSCLDNENDLHQQKLADIEAQYEPMFTWLEDEMEQAERDRDDMRLEEVQREQEMYEEMKAADLSAEMQRHEAALADCPS